jgi:hypothetical protein
MQYSKQCYNCQCFGQLQATSKMSLVFGVAIATNSAPEKENGAIIMKCFICGARHSISYKGCSWAKENRQRREGNAAPSKNSPMLPCIQTA